MGGQQRRELTEWERIELDRDERFARLAAKVIVPEVRRSFEGVANTLAGTHRRAVPDTLTTDVEGARRGTFGVPVALWPLVDALAVELRSGDPLVKLAEVPTPETPSAEKAPLGGTTIKVTASMPKPADHALFTDIALQAASSPNVVAAVTGIMSASLAAAIDAAVAAELASSATAAASVGEALAAVAAWPGQRLVVLSPNAVGGVNDLVALAAASQGAITVLIDPFIGNNLVIARVGVAVGVLGIDTLGANRPSRLGIDKTTYAGVAVEAAAGAVATWPSP
jgi:hypothetical protein